MKKYKVEQRLGILDNWQDAEWTLDGEPQRFDTEQEAQDAIDEHVTDSEEAAADGDLEEAYHSSDYRVVQCDD